MHEHPAIFLIEVLYGTGFGIELHGAGRRSSVLAVWEIDARELGVEGASNEGTEEGRVGVVAIKGGKRRRVGWGNERKVAEGGEVLGAVGLNVG